MDSGVLDRVRQSLLAKRQAIETWTRESPPEDVALAPGEAGQKDLERHLAVIDSSLAKAEAGTLGVCTECHEPVENDLIQMDYTRCVCLTHLSETEQRSLERELELAQTVQQSLLPQEVPSLPYVDIAAFSRPAQYVGGDFFDFFPFADGRQGMAIADVVGHGMSSSLIMASLQTMLRTMSQSVAHPADLAASLNRLSIHNIQFTTFITLFMAAFEPEHERLVYCNAGHNPPLLIHSQDRTADWLSLSGSAIGLAEESTYREKSAAARAGDLLFLYTDGVTEYTRADGELFGSDRLVDVLKADGDRTAQESLNAVRQALDEFSGGRAPDDDITMVACRFGD
jgi:sigma-B regulation protein RsbU (phosphoserine phosphatase)